MYQYLQPNYPKNGLNVVYTSKNSLTVSRHSPTEGHCEKSKSGSDGYELILINRGNALLDDGQGLCRINERDILFVFPQSRYEFKEAGNLGYIKISFGQNYLKKHGISLSSEHSYQLFRTNLIDRFSLSKEEYKDIYADAAGLEKKLKITPDVPYFQDIIRNSFVEIIYDLFLIKNKRSAYEPFRQDTKVKITSRFLKLLSEKFLYEKRVNYYASALCVTPRHLSHVVKLTTDKTARELVDEFVIKEAKLLLQSSSLNISEVALKLQFADASFFGKYFKKQTGISPSQYKFSAVIAV